MRNHLLIAAHPARHGLCRPVERANEASRANAGSFTYWYSNNSNGALGPDDGPESFWRRPQAAGGDEISELQSMFPSTPWPPSMRD